MKFQVERELHRQELMRERERKMVEDKFEQLKPAMQRVAPLTKRQIAVVSLHERLAPALLIPYPRGFEKSPGK